jgi:hypothetical protein
MTRYLTVCALVCLTFTLQKISIAQLAEVKADECKAQGGTLSVAHQGIPGDGNVHDMSTSAPQGKTRFIGSYIRTMRQNLDNDYKWRCMLNPPQPPSVDNSLQRRCDDQAQDMSVERCTVTSGSSPVFVCEYANATGANAKLMEMTACWKD